jgi:hypothetical protein
MLGVKTSMLSCSLVVIFLCKCVFCDLKSATQTDNALSQLQDKCVLSLKKQTLKVLDMLIKIFTNGKCESEEGQGLQQHKVITYMLVSKLGFTRISNRIIEAKEVNTDNKIFVYNR